MINCPACGTEILGQDRFCKNCGALVAASVEDLADTRPFDPSARRVKSGSLDPDNPLYANAPTTYPLAQNSATLHNTQSFIRNLLHRKLVWLLAVFLLVLFLGTGATIGREVIRHRRARRLEQALEDQRARQAKKIKQATVARRILEEAIQNAMGFVPENVSDVEFPDLSGIFVTSLTSDDGPAAVAHIQAGDVLIELGGQPVRNVAEIVLVLNSLKPGSEVAIKLLRDEVSVASRIRIASSSIAPFQPKIEPKDQGFLGVGNAVRRCCIAGTRRWGLEVHRVVDNSPADLAGLQQGDVITEFDKQTIRTPNELARRVHAVKPRSKVKVKFYRGNAEQTVEMTMGHGW